MHFTTTTFCATLALLLSVSTAVLCSPTRGRTSRSNLSSVTLDIGTLKPATLNGALRFTVPYAQAPVGNLRYANPQTLTSLPKGYDASVTAPSCYQDTTAPRGGNTPSEDCLYMNVYVPSSATSYSDLPIVMWLPGGSFIGGSATASGLDGSLLASEQNVIVIIAQYRLGLFGWLQTEHTLDESSGGAPGGSTVGGNQAVRDVIAALQFVQKYGGQFGGNVSRVTLTGQSSGAHMVRALLTTAAGYGLFSQAILVSDTQDYGMATQRTQNELGSWSLQTLGCSDIACARNASAEDVSSATETIYSEAPYIDGSIPTGETWRPTLGNYIPATLEKFPSTPGGRKIILTTISNEAGNAVGSLLEETPAGATTLELMGDNGSLTFQDAANDLFNGGRGDTLANASVYAPSSSANKAKIAADDGLRSLVEELATDGMWRCAVQRNAMALQAAGNSVYLAQHFNGVTYPSNAGVAYCAEKGKHCHEDDIYLIFGTYPSSATAAQRAMSKELRARWGAFARTGSPNVAGYPAWGHPTASNLHILQVGIKADGSSNVSTTQHAQACQHLWGTKVKFDWQMYG